MSSAAGPCGLMGARRPSWANPRRRGSLELAPDREPAAPDLPLGFTQCPSPIVLRVVWEGPFEEALLL
jgi:hypothetical protein